MKSLVVPTLFVLTAFAGGSALTPFSLAPGPQAPPAAVLPEGESWAKGDETLYWHGDPDRGFNISGTYSYGCAARFTEDDGLVVKAILYYLTGNADDVFVYTAGESTMAAPGPMLDTTRATGLGGGVWRRANMPNQPAIDPGRDFWACVLIRRHPSGQYPLTLDLGPIVPWRGGYITIPMAGPDWFQLTDPPFWTDRNVCIRAVIERSGVGVEEVISPTEPTIGARVRPSPIRSVGQFSFNAARPGPVSLQLFDVAGNTVRTLYDGHASAGEKRLSWDCRDGSGRRVPAGTYLYRLTAEGRSATGKAVVLD